MKPCSPKCEGRTAVAEALERLRDLPFEDIGFAKLDHHRALRTGMPEVIFAAGKTPAQVGAIFAHMAEHGGKNAALLVAVRFPPLHGLDWPAWLERFFVYGGLIWLLGRAGMRPVST